ncbi:MAG: serine--tRNA ligase [bacterium]|nr:serine--tRNA ligase [bacterium]
MLDIKFTRDNLKEVKKAVKDRNKDIDVEHLLVLDDQRRKIITEMETMRAQQNKASKEAAGAKENREDLKALKEKIKNLQAQLGQTEKEYQELMLQMPNMPDKDVPIGKDESGNKVVRKSGKPPEFSFKPKDHLEIGESLGIIDVKQAANVSGSRFCYLKGKAALLQMALLRYAWDILLKKGFTPVIPPVLSKIETVLRTGHPEAVSDDAYRTTADDLALVGSSEQSLMPMHMDQVLEAKALPARYTGYSTCFRREAGTYGKDTRGIFRQHQFDKVEMVCLTKPEDSEKEFDFLLSIQEELVGGLGLPYQVVNVCTGDMSFASAKQYDLEVWLPSQEKYRETHSLNNCRDFQTRRLNIKYKTPDGKKELTHALNATAFAMGRTLIAILENYQQKDGSVLVPKALQKYCGFSTIRAK